MMCVSMYCVQYVLFGVFVHSLRRMVWGMVLYGMKELLVLRVQCVKRGVQTGVQCVAFIAKIMS